ncbi:acyltransferase [Piscinibacter sp. HJYY11]|uniref:acyltransferase n=1 Tax=Piscinibacter sp. HJYY11 TaxID=2801333 RepID=UPI00191D9AB8|nr:acyltransferase [Piscinibacter sp. HJYY11]MBL0727344.1 acyltransferase [Piscinibacter sp. HJYY11]
MKRLFERLTAKVLAANPLDLESMVRGFLIQYFFHTSDRGRIAVVGEGRRSINLLTPTQFKGLGRIVLSTTTVFGVPRSPGSYGCSYVESRTPESLIQIGAGTVFNNRAFILSEGASVTFGERVLVGPELHVADSNSHQLELGLRAQPDAKPLPVVIGDDVFIGSRVTILKGARIGRGCVISAGTVVTPNFEAPEMSIVAGNPCRIVGRVKDAASTDNSRNETHEPA